jgi:sugar/nucleoside kinase (ribokinase family)
MSGGLLQLSGVVVDFQLAIERLPGPGEEVRARGAQFAAGGGFNAMAAARRHGAQVAYGGALGRGRFAEIAREALAAEGVEALQARRPEADQGVCVVLALPNGERSFVLHPGAERMADPEDYESLPTARFAWALLGGYAAPDPPEPDAFGAWLARLPRTVRLMFDPTPLALTLPPARLAAALDRADWISANAREAAALTGASEPGRAAQALAQGREGAIVRDGAQGCWLSLAGARAAAIAGFAVAAVDATGAGDTHIGAFIAASLAGRAPLEAARLANAAAALSVTAFGPAASPTLEQTLALLDATS